MRARLGEHAGLEEGDLTGPNPVDRGKYGSKIHLITEQTCLPIFVVISDGSTAATNARPTISWPSRASPASSSATADSLTNSGVLCRRIEHRREAVRRGAPCRASSWAALGGNHERRRPYGAAAACDLVVPGDRDGGAGGGGTHHPLPALPDARIGRRERPGGSVRGADRTPHHPLVGRRAFGPSADPSALLGGARPRGRTRPATTPTQGAGDARARADAVRAPARRGPHDRRPRRPAGTCHEPDYHRRRVRVSVPAATVGGQPLRRWRPSLGPGRAAPGCRRRYGCRPPRPGGQGPLGRRGQRDLAGASAVAHGRRPDLRTADRGREEHGLPLARPGTGYRP